MHRNQSNDYHGQLFSDAFDPGSTDASAAVVHAVTDAANVEPWDLDPLYEAIEPEALNALVGDSDGAPIAVSFEYQGYEVFVRGRGEVVLTEPAESGNGPPS